mmetsp:Transcript_134415/g.233234  ORF Transcript_134415/g.233234 Transcript_134415/m.233234 type:complete len:105 (-) Transcript_134415:185-499(-)
MLAVPAPHFAPNYFQAGSRGSAKPHNRIRTKYVIYPQLHIVCMPWTLLPVSGFMARVGSVAVIHCVQPLQVTGSYTFLPVNATTLAQLVVDDFQTAANPLLFLH